ncbi:MAG: nucleotidyltransferase family protein [Bacillota bacterium]|nr:nucleotidyltransferase family protein [Bacillota bacterium]
MTKYTIDDIRRIIKPLAEKYGVAQIYLFGSYARGDATECSDIDLLVYKGSVKGLFALCGFYTDLETVFSVKIDLLTSGSLSEDFRNRIKDEEVLIYAA